MRVSSNQQVRSRFLSVDKDLDIILTAMMQNERLKRLLYYTTPDCLTRPNVGDQNSLEIMRKNIRIIPKLYVDNEVLNYIIVVFDKFFPNGNNPEFRNNTITFNIICHYDQWQLNDMSLRPIKIAAELDFLFNDKYLTGIGRTYFLRAYETVFTDEYAGMVIEFLVVHGEEDKKEEVTEDKQQQLELDVKDLFDNGYSLSSNGRH